MRNRIFFVFVLVLMSAASVAQAQYSVYAEGGSAWLKNGPKGDFLYGGQAGVLVNGTTFRQDRLKLFSDVQARIFQQNGESYQAVVLGPRLSTDLNYHRVPKLVRGINPFVEFNLGFANYKPGSGGATTDFQFGGEAGASHKIFSRLDGVLTYSYSRYLYNYGFYRPQSFGLGAIYHLTTRQGK
jgi:hypothetical protein